MKREKKEFNIYYILLSILLLLGVVLGGFSAGTTLSYADTTVYSGVIEDMQKDESFNIDDYPVIANDYGLRVEQVAESTSRELFLYVYQPTGAKENLRATRVNMALTDDLSASTDETGTKLYDLLFVNCFDTLYKYKVLGLTVSTDEIRYYNITSIYRKYNSKFDTGSSSESIITQVSFPVGKLYIVKGENDNISYECDNVQVVQILNPFFGYVKYTDVSGFGTVFGSCDCHYIAFDTDLPIDCINYARISYSSQWRYTYTAPLNIGNQDKKGDKISIVTTVKQSDYASGRVSLALWTGEYNFSRIVTVPEFLKKESISSSVKNKISDLKWVIRFTETSRQKTQSDGCTTETWTEVSDVTILELGFSMYYKRYIMGAVSDAGNAGENPSNTNTTTYQSLLDRICAWLESVTGIPAWIWKIIICALPFVILLPVLIALFPIIGQVLLWAVKGIAWVICLPFKGVAALVRKIKKE